MLKNARKSSRQRIGIVGGGASTVCLLDRLARLGGSGPGSVTVFDPSRNLWRGRAYQDDVDSVLTNIAPSAMSVRAGDGDHFVRWLAQAGLPHGTGDFTDDGYFPPRHVFGSYLEAVAEEAMAVLERAGRLVRVDRDTVVSAREHGEDIAVTTEDGTVEYVDHLVSAVGVGLPADHYTLAGRPGFHGDPYPLSRTLDGIPEAADVTVLGTGLAAIDVVVSLAAGGHRGPISLVSRNGALPPVRQRPRPLELAHFTPANLHRLAARSSDGRIGLTGLLEVLAKELAEQGADPTSVLAELSAVTDESPMGRLRRQYDAIDAWDMGLRTVQRAIPATGPDAWTLLRPEDQEYIRHNHHRAIMNLCCPLPPENARTLLHLHDEGQLRVRSGVRDVTPREAGGFHVALADTGYETDVVVNAVSVPSHRIPPAARPFVESLVDDGRAAYHPAGGLDVEPASSRLTRTGRVHPRMYAIGDLAAGTLFFTSGMPSVVDRADDITRVIADGAKNPEGIHR